MKKKLYTLYVWLIIAGHSSSASKPAPGFKAAGLENHLLAQKFVSNISATQAVSLLVDLSRRESNATEICVDHNTVDTLQQASGLPKEELIKSAQALFGTHKHVVN